MHTIGLDVLVYLAASIFQLGQLSYFVMAVLNAVILMVAAFTGFFAEVAVGARDLLNRTRQQGSC